MTAVAPSRDDRRTSQALADLLADLRLRAGLSPTEMAQLIGYSRGSVYGVERGGRDPGYLGVRSWLAACGSRWRLFGDELQLRDPLMASGAIGGDNDHTVFFDKTMRPLEALGAAVRTYRRAAGLTQEALANGGGYDRPLLQTIERGERNPRLRTIRRILIGLPANWLMLFSFVDRLDPIAREGGTQLVSVTETESVR